MANAAELTKAGIAAAQAGDKEKAADLLRQATEADPKSEMAWLWRSSVATSEDEKRGYLQQALLANPQSAPARKGLALLGPAIDAPPELAGPVAVVAPVATDDRAMLQWEIERRTAKGWQVVSQSDTGVQFKKPKQWSAAGLAFFVAAPALVGCLWPVAFGIALIGLLLVFADYASKKEELVFSTADQAREEARKVREGQKAIPQTATLFWQWPLSMRAKIAIGATALLVIALIVAGVFSLLQGPPARLVTMDGGGQVEAINLWDDHATRGTVTGQVHSGDMVRLLRQSGDGCQVERDVSTRGWVTCANFIKEFK